MRQRSGGRALRHLKSPTCFFREQSWDILPCPLHKRLLAVTQSDSVIRSSFRSLLYSTLDHLDAQERRCFMKKGQRKLTLSKETLRTLDEKELSRIVGGAQSGNNTPPNGGPNSCPNTKRPGCS